MPLTVLAAALAVAAAAAPAPAPKAAPRARPPAAKTPSPPAPRLVRFKTRDGWTLDAAWRPPRRGGVVVVLAHGVGSSRTEWDGLAGRLQRDGVGTLALDLRGHAGSTAGPGGTRSWETFDADGEWVRAVEDLLAARRWLEGRGVPARRIAFGGASIGANLAAAAAVRAPAAPFLLLLSPGPDYHGVRLGLRKGQPTLIGAAPTDPYAYGVLAPAAKVPGVRTFTAPAGHGVQMFRDPAALDRVARWIEREARPLAR
jgi:dienelactone hydrolase